VPKILQSIFLLNKKIGFSLVLRIRIRDPVIFYLLDPGSGIRIQDQGFGMRKCFDPGPDPRSGIKRPGSATLLLSLTYGFNFLKNH
jgi:hypothetical protein